MRYVNLIFWLYIRSIVMNQSAEVVARWFVPDTKEMLKL